MTSHVEDFVWGAFNVVQTSIFGSSSSADIHDHDTNEWTRQLGGGGGGAEGGKENDTHISFQDLYASIVSIYCSEKRHQTCQLCRSHLAK